MNSIHQSAHTLQSQQQQTAQHDMKQLLDWLNLQISKKNIPKMTSTLQLASGNIFLQIVSVYYPKKVDLTRTFIRPKDDYQVLQNFKQLSAAFAKLGWKKVDPQKYRKRKDKDLTSMALYLKKILSQHFFGDNQTSNVHSMLSNYPSPSKAEQSKQNSHPIRKQDRKSVTIPSHKQSIKKAGESQLNHVKSGHIKNKLSTTYSTQPTGIPPKMIPHPNNVLKSHPFQPVHTKQITSHKLPPHLFQSSKNIGVSTSNIKAQQQQFNNFQNMRITKLQKQKSILLKKILQIQQLISREKSQIPLLNNTKVQDAVDYQNINNQQNSQNNSKMSQDQKRNVLRVKNQIFKILSDLDP